MDDEGLRSRLVREGVDLLATQGIQALTLREIARRAGVSHGAPRRYFPTHLELLSAIAREGFADLAAEVAAVLRRDRGKPRAQLLALGRRYLDFAWTRPGMFALMFRHDLLDSNQRSRPAGVRPRPEPAPAALPLGLRDTSLPLFRTLTDLVARARPAADPPPAVVAGALWANLHGIALLWGWGSLPLALDTPDVEPLLRAALEAHLGPVAR